MATKPAGPFVPGCTATTRYSMAGDDCSLHFDLNHLTAKQREDHHSNQVLTAMLQVALMYIAKPEDAKLVLAVKNKNIPYNGITKKLVEETFPGFLEA